MSTPCDCEIKIAQVQSSDKYKFTEFTGKVVKSNGELYFERGIHPTVNMPGKFLMPKVGETGPFQVRTSEGLRRLDVFVDTRGFVARLVFHPNSGPAVAVGRPETAHLVRVTPPGPANCGERAAVGLVSRYQDCKDGTLFLRSLEATYVVPSGDEVDETGQVITTNFARNQSLQEAKLESERLVRSRQSERMRRTRESQLLRNRPAHHTNSRSTTAGAAGEEIQIQQQQQPLISINLPANPNIAANTSSVATVVENSNGNSRPTGVRIVKKGDEEERSRLNKVFGLILLSVIALGVAAFAIKKYKERNAQQAMEIEALTGLRQRATYSTTAHQSSHSATAEARRLRRAARH